MSKTSQRITTVLIAAVAVATFVACSPADENGACVDGAEACPCTPEGTCDAGLECVIGACVDPNLVATGFFETESDSASFTGPSSDTDTDTATATETATASESQTGPTTPITAVDVLFVVDNSSGTASAQRELASSISSFVDPLGAAGFSVRVAVTTTDDGNYWCAGQGVSQPESGQFVRSRCTDRLDDFTFLETDDSAACTEVCSGEDLGEAGGPWLEEPTAGQLACALPQGVNGCGFESPLESMQKAIRRADDGGSDEFGFVRPDAHLAVIVVTNEADCSDNPAFENDLFAETGPRTFWPDPSSPSPTSATCWSAGVGCVADDCSAQDKDSNGALTDGASAVLHPVSRYTEQLASLAADKSSVGASVFSFGIVGVPEDYPQTGALSYNTDPDPDTALRFGVGLGCSNAGTEAVPPVRVREVFEEAGTARIGALYSVCSASYAASLGDMASRIVNGQ